MKAPFGASPHNWVPALGNSRYNFNPAAGKENSIPDFPEKTDPG
jgi:hypothetical protein